MRNFGFVWLLFFNTILDNGFFFKKKKIILLYFKNYLFFFKDIYFLYSLYFSENE